MKSGEYRNHIEAATKNPKAYGLRECVLCGREVISVVGIYFPGGELAARLSAPPGKIRTVLYALCEECASKGQISADRVEVELSKDLDSGMKIRRVEEMNKE